MATPVELALLVLAVAALVAGARLLRNARALAVNAVAGVVVLVLANLLGLGVEISLLAVLVCALAGVPGAVLVVLLAYLEVAFVATALPALA